jgi:hypothetical protein
MMSGVHLLSNSLGKADVIERVASGASIILPAGTRALCGP